MALFSSLFKGRGVKKEEPKAPQTSEGTPTQPHPVSPSFSSKAVVGKTVPNAPPKLMQFEEIVAALQQIESIMAEPSEVATAEAAVAPDHLQTVSLGLGDVMRLVPSSFHSMPVVLGDKVDVVIENLYGQMSKGKVETTLGHLLAGVPTQYLVNPADLESETNVSLPLSLIVAAVDPEDMKRRTGAVRKDSIASGLPDLFATASSVPAQPEAAPTAKKPTAAAPKPESFASLRLKLSDLQTVMPSSINSAAVSPDVRVDVPIEDVFGQLAKGKVEVPANRLLAAVPKPYIAEGAALDTDVPVALPLSVIVSAIPPNELKKRTAEQPAKSIARDLPDIFKRAAGKETPQPAAVVIPTAPAIPVPEAAREAAPIVTPEVPSVSEAKPEPQVEATAPFAGPAPKKFLPIDLIAGESAAPPSPEQSPAPKVEKSEPPMPVESAETQTPVEKSEPPVSIESAETQTPVTLSDVPVLLLRGLDLNQASSEELMRVVDGIGESMAQRIVAERIQNGPFFGLYDLGRVPGIGAKIYEKMTGQPWLEEKYGQLPMVNEILGRWTGRHPDFRDVAAKFKAIPGFEGCVILHRDGYLLAASWQMESPDRLQAMAPQMFKKVKHYMRHIVQGDLCSVTVSYEGFSFTFVESEDICFVAVHNSKGLSRRHIQIVHGLGVALGRRFSGYRGA
jgi:competence ComEA-like helix-hairpin-helix protein